ncbi:DUF6415 family natural product biosynthesis protein [Streptomyces sp. NPDC053367]|uniref:DUF6415 family natural product biosynthesis protein n=1 Tax=Streptomyces sp. NPDC053367 TaxID=3365700 RepID=UPI0037D6DED8
MNAVMDTSGATALVDLEAMRETIGIVLCLAEAPHALLDDAEELDTLTAMLSGHLEMLIPEVERLVRSLPMGSVQRYCGLACLGDARQRLRSVPSHHYGGPPGHARRLARALHALCEHYTDSV